MSPIELARPGIAQLSRGWLGTGDEAPWSGLLVWRVRLWLLALAVGLIAAHTDGEATRLAQRQTAKQAECSAAVDRPARRPARTAPPPAFKDCARQGVDFGPADL